jgi:hypothetical protein
VKRYTVIAVSGICATLTACGGSGGFGGSGGSEPSLTRRDVEHQGRQWVKAQAKKNVSVAAPRCFENPDARHWRCATELRGKAGAKTHITFAATCNAESCQYKIVFRA